MPHMNCFFASFHYRWLVSIGFHQLVAISPATAAAADAAIFQPRRQPMADARVILQLPPLFSRFSSLASAAFRFSFSPPFSPPFARLLTSFLRFHFDFLFFFDEDLPPLSFFRFSPFSLSSSFIAAYATAFFFRHSSCAVSLIATPLHYR